MSLKHQVLAETRIGALKARYGTTPIGKLRTLYGPQFARGCTDGVTLSEVLHKLDETTLTKLVTAQEDGELAKIRET